MQRKGGRGEGGKSVKREETFEGTVGRGKNVCVCVYIFIYMQMFMCVCEGGGGGERRREMTLTYSNPGVSQRHRCIFARAIPCGTLNLPRRHAFTHNSRTLPIACGIRLGRPPACFCL